MEHKIGEIFEYDGDWYQCLESGGCSYCDFYELLNCSVKFNVVGECVNRFRSDGKPVVFKKLEKVGEPLKINGKIYQGLISPYGFNNCSMCAFRNISCKDVISCYDDYIFIEIETKEDMEEKKLNLKPFDIQKAKEGKSVYTRDGRKARIICFDAKCADTPIVALVSLENEEEYLYRYYRDGKFKKDGDSDVDLMMLPEKIEGWVNVYKDGDNNYRSVLYINEEVALSRKGSDYITTFKIYWEE